MSDQHMSDQCHALRDSLLAADPDQLRGHGESDLARHIRSCEQCSVDAERILGATALLAADLNRAARAKSSRPIDAPANTLPTWWALPIAAVLASVLIVGWMQKNEPEVVPRVGLLQDVKRPVDAPVVNIPTDGSVAVFRTAENITVVWNLGAKGGS